MKKSQRINNLEELRLELRLLKAQAHEQEAYLAEQYGLLKQKVNGPMQFMNNLISWIPGVDMAKELFGSAKGGKNKDWVSRLFSAGSAALMNRLFLRRTGFLKRILITAFTQQTASLMNQDRAAGIIRQLIDWVKGTDESETEKGTSRKGKRATVQREPVPAPDFGIPPDSETS